MKNAWYVPVLTALATIILIILLAVVWTTPVVTFSYEVTDKQVTYDGLYVLKSNTTYIAVAPSDWDTYSVGDTISFAQNRIYRNDFDLFKIKLAEAFG